MGPTHVANPYDFGGLSEPMEWFGMLDFFSILN
jgi:hypothetical protein